MQLMGETEIKLQLVAAKVQIYAKMQCESPGEKKILVCRNIHTSGNIQIKFEKFHEFFQTFQT